MSDEIEAKELQDCIKCLVREATDAVESGDNDEDDVESNEDHQTLVRQVESKLLEFLEDQAQLAPAATPGDETKYLEIDESSKLPIRGEHSYPCPDTYKILPSSPDEWPQRPCMIRPTPGSTTKIRGIRYVSERQYRHVPGFCAGCVLPVNTGKEIKGKSLVIDFESAHFVGTLLMRIRDIPKAEKESEENEKSYFENRKRRFQAIVKGKFKTPLKMCECVTGQAFSRRAGKLPAKWIVSTFVKFVSTLAPQLEATIDGNSPCFLVPLVATAHTVRVEPYVTMTKVFENEIMDERLFNYSVYAGSTDIDMEDSEEPHPCDASSIMQDAHRDLGISLPSKNSKLSVPSRMKLRKKTFNSISAQKSLTPCFSLENEYTFEFYQHLLIFHEKEFVLDMGRPIGKVPLSPATDGQPIKFLSAHRDPKTGTLDSLWSFDIWHESMFTLAKRVHGKEG